MDETLKIIIKGTLDKETEKEINAQIKSLKIEPININVNINQKNNKIVEETENVFKKISKTSKSFSSEIIKQFGITNRESIREIRQAAEELFTAFQIKDQNQITKSYDNLFNKIKDSFYKLKVEITDNELDFLNYFKSHKIYIDNYIKSDFNKDEWKYYRDNLRGIYTANAKKGISINSLSSEIYGQFGELFSGGLPFNAHDEFRQIVDKFIETRRKLKGTIGDTEIENVFGSDKDIRNNINNILNTYISSINSKEPQVKEAVEKIRNNIKSLTRIENKLEEREKEYEILDIKAQKSGIGLNSDYIDSFYEGLDNKDLEESRHNLSMLQKEWRALNAAMEKEMPNTALENMKKNISLMPTAIESVEIKLKRLSNPTEEIKERVSNLKVQLENLYKLKSNDEQLSVYSKIKKEVVSLNKELNNQIQIQRQANKEKNLEVDKQTFLNRINTWIRKNSEAAKVFEEDIVRIKAQLASADGIEFTNLKKQFTEINTKAASMGIKSKSGIEKIVDSFKKFHTIVTGSAIFNEIYQNVVSIDNAMVNLKKVTDETAETYKKFSERATKSAVKLGVGIPEIMNATADFARLGYPLKEASVLGETAALYKNVSYTDIGTATKDIVSAMKAFKIEAKDSIKIVDKLNEVGNKFSISSAGLGEGLRRSAASLAIANSSLDESLALITAANEVIQDPSEAGNSVKILALRLTGAKGKLEELGESTDNVVESVTALQTKLLNLTNGKVNIMQDINTFKSPAKIMIELADAWDEINNVKQNEILELIAGKQRQNAIASIIRNIQTLKDVLGVASDSAGSAAKEQEKRMDSINAKIEQLKANVQSLSNSLLNSDLIKFFVDLGSKGVESLDYITKAVGPLTTVLTTLTTISTLMGKQRSPFGILENEKTGKNELSFLGTRFSEIKENWENAKSFKEKINSLFTSNNVVDNTFEKQLNIDIQALNNYKNILGSAKDHTKAFEQAMTGASGAARSFAQNNIITAENIKKYADMQKKATVATKGLILKTVALDLAAAALNATITFGISLAIEGTVNLIHKWATAQERAIEKSNELIKSHEEQAKKIQENTQAIENIKQEYKTLSKGVDVFGKNLNLTTQEYERYNNIANKIAEMFPELVQGRTAEGNAIIKQKGNIELLNKALREHIELLEGAKLKDAPDTFKGLYSKIYESKNTDKWNFVNQESSLAEQYKYAKEIINNIDIFNDEDIKTVTEKIENDKKIKKIKEALMKDTENSMAITDLLKKSGLELPLFTSYDNIINIIRENKEKVKAGYNQIQSELNEQTSKIISDVIIPNMINTQEYKSQIPEIQDYMKSMLKGIDFSELPEENRTYNGINKWVTENIVKPISENKNNVQNSLKELLSLDAEKFSENKEEYNEKLNEFVNNIAETLKLDPNTIKRNLGLDNISTVIDESLKGVIDKARSLDGEIKAIQKSIDNLAPSLSDLESALRTVNEGHYLSGQEVAKLIAKYPELRDKVLETSRGYTFEKDAIEKVIKIKIEEQRVSIQAQIDQTKNTIKNIATRLKGYKSEISAIHNITEARKALAIVNEKISNETIWDKIKNSVGEIFFKKPKLSDFKKDLEDYIEAEEKINALEKETDKLQEQLNFALKPNYLRAANEASKATKDHKKALDDNRRALEKQKKALGEQKKALEEQKKALEEQKKALSSSEKTINSLIDMTVKMLKRQKEAEKETLKESLDGYKKKIDLMKKALDVQQREHKFQEELEEKTLSINRIQIQLEYLRNDDSAEARKRRAELNEKLRKENKELNKFIYEYNIENQKKELDEEYKQFKSGTDKQIKEIDNSLKQEGQLRQEAMRLIEGQTQEFYDRLMKWNLDYGDGTRETVIKVWDKAYEELGKFNTGQINVAGTLAYISEQMRGIDESIVGINKQVDSVNATIDGVSKQIDKTTDTINNLKNAAVEAGKALNFAKEEYVKLADEERKRALEKENEAVRLADIQFNSEQLTGARLKKYLDDTLNYYRPENSEKRINEIKEQFNKQIAENKNSQIFPKEFEAPINTLKEQAKKFLPETLKEQLKIIKNSFSNFPKLFGYAKGTQSAKKGLAKVDEKGKEAILSKATDGRYRFMNEGDVVFTKEATKRLWEFANSKTNFVGQQVIPKEIGTRTFYNNNTVNNMSNPIVNIEIKGNADIETVRALRNESEKIVKKAVEETLKTANKYAKIM